MNEFHRIDLVHQVRVGAPAERLYDLVADVTRMGEWSPECHQCVWTMGRPSQLGSRFIGSNVERDPVTAQEWIWDMLCEVIAADFPRRFGWSVLTEAWDADTSVWTFAFDRDDDATIVTQTFAMKRPPTGLQELLDRRSPPEQIRMIDQRRRRLDAGMRATLAALKNAAEQERSTT